MRLIPSILHEFLDLCTAVIHYVFTATKIFIVCCSDPNQLYVYFHMESPAYITLSERRTKFSKFDGNFINLTMTYRSDAHVSASYRIKGDLPNIILNGKGKQWIDELLAKKKKLAVCRVNNFFV